MRERRREREERQVGRERKSCQGYDENDHKELGNGG